MKNKKEALAKLVAAHAEIEHVLRDSVPAARYDPPPLRFAIRSRLASVNSDLAKLISDLEGEQ